MKQKGFSDLRPLSSLQAQRLRPGGAVHREGGPGRRRRVQPGRGVLLRPGSPLPAQLHLQVQGDSGRGAAPPVSTRVPQRVAAGRSPAQVSWGRGLSF